MLPVHQNQHHRNLNLGMKSMKIPDRILNNPSM